MVKLSADVIRNLGKIRPTKAKPENIVNGVNVNSAAKKASKKAKRTAAVANDYVRSPQTDVVNINGVEKTNKATKTNQAQNQPRRACIGDFFIEQNRKWTEPYLNDLDKVAQKFPDVSFVREANIYSTKSLESTLSKLARTDEAIFAQGGLLSAVRDGMRATMYMPNAATGYEKIVKEMEALGYKLADTFAEDSKGFMIIGKDGMPIMTKDIAIRMGEKAQPSGYEDVQMRFIKKGKIFELIILPGPNYHAVKEMEHKAVYEPIRKYKELGFTKDTGSDKVIDGIKKEVRSVTGRLYKDAEMRDTNGAASITEPVTFTKKGVQNLKELFDSLEDMWRGQYLALPPSKRTKPFKETQKYKQLSEIRASLMEFVNKYSPIDQ